MVVDNNEMMNHRLMLIFFIKKPLNIFIQRENKNTKYDRTQNNIDH